MQNHSNPGTSFASPTHKGFKEMSKRATQLARDSKITGYKAYGSLSSQKPPLKKRFTAGAKSPA